MSVGKHGDELKREKMTHIIPRESRERTTQKTYKPISLNAEKCF